MDRTATFHSIQLLRAVAALLVVLFHAHLAFAKGYQGTLFANESYVLSFGAVGVHLFFVISGFIMVHTMRPDGFTSRAFMRRRLMRIYPIYWICAALYLAAHALLGRAYDLDPQNLIGALLLVPGNAPDIIGPAWTLSFEMYFYIAFALFMALGLTRGLIALSGFFLASIAARFVIGWDNPVLNLAGNSLLLEFLAGTAIGWLTKTGRLPKRGGLAAILGSIVLFLGGLVYGFDRVPGVIIWGIPSALLILGVVQVEQRSPSSAFVRKFGLLGDASYALYLIHILVITLLLELVDALGVHGAIPPILAAVGTAVVASITAIGLHWKVERPLLRLLNPGRALVPQRQGPVSELAN